MHFWREPKLGERPPAEAEAARVKGATEGQRAVPDAEGKRRHGDQIAEDVEVRKDADTSALAALFGSQGQLPEGGSPRLRAGRNSSAGRNQRGPGGDNSGKQCRLDKPAAKEKSMTKEIKIGRPKKEQTKPLIFEHVRSRVTRQVSMSAKTADDLGRYVAWAAAAADADEQDAMTLTMDQALGQFFQRDKLFKEVVDDRTDAGGARTESANKSAASPSPPVGTKANEPAALPPSRSGVPS
jgi:hypothetical protein